MKLSIGKVVALKSEAGASMIKVKIVPALLRMLMRTCETIENVV